MDPIVSPPLSWTSGSSPKDHPILYNLAVLTALAVVLALCFRLQAGFAVSAFYCLVLAVAQSFRGSYASSLLISSAAAAAIDYLFMQPLYSFRMTDPQEMLAMGTFLVSSLAVTHLSRRLQKQRNGIANLYRAAQGLLGEQATGAFGTASLQVLVDAFAPQLRSAHLYDPATGEMHAAGESGRDAAGCAFLTQSAAAPPPGWTVRQVRLNGGKTAVAGFQGLPDPELLADPLASLAGLAFEKARAFRAASLAAATVESETLRTAILDALAHEFKTPLAVILAASGGVREAGPAAPEQSELLESIEQEAARLGSLTTRLLRLARLEREDIQLHAETVDAAEVIGPLMQRYKDLFPARSFTFIGAGAEKQEVRADVELLRLAIGQLLDNAVAYGAPEEPIDTFVEESPGMLAISVANAGPPIPVEERERVFERFHRGSKARASTSSGGTGLGLYVARKIAVAHGGGLELLPPPVAADPSCCERSVFRLSIPLGGVDQP